MVRRRFDFDGTDLVFSTVLFQSLHGSSLLFIWAGLIVSASWFALGCVPAAGVFGWSSPAWISPVSAGGAHVGMTESELEMTCGAHTFFKFKLILGCLLLVSYVFC